MRRLPANLGVCLAGLMVATPARADPVSIITGIATWYSTIGVVGQIIVQAAVGAALSIASYGLSYLLTGGGKKQEQGQQTETQGTKLPEMDGLLEVCRAYGTVVTAGAVFFSKTVAGPGATQPNRWVLGLAVSEGVCDGLVSVIINGVECPLDDGGTPQISPWSVGSSVYFRASFRAGTDAQSQDYLIASRFPSPPEDFYPGAANRSTRWSEFRQRGVATVVLDMDWGTDPDHHVALWGVGGVPQLQLKLRGLRLYDRSSPTQDPDDPSTWTWTDIATIAIEDYLVAGIGADADRDEIDGWSAVASIAIDREYVPVLAGGVEQRGRVNGVVYSRQSPVDILAGMAQQNRAIIQKTGGKYSIRSDSPAAPVATVWKGQWRDSWSMQGGPDVRSRASGVVVQFYPAIRLADASEVAYPAAGLDDPNATRLTLPFCDSPAAAQRLAYAIYTENGLGRTISGVFDISVLVAPGKANRQLEVGDCIRWDAPAPYDDLNGLFKVDDLRINADFSVSLSLSGTSSDVIGGWSTALEAPFTATA